MIVYAVLPAYDKNDKIYHQVLPYNLGGTIKLHFSKNMLFNTKKGYHLISRIIALIKFLSNCRIKESAANAYAKKLDKNEANLNLQ